MPKATAQNFSGSVAIPTSRLSTILKSLTLLVCLLFAAPACAYIDPNAGGWLYQLLFPLIVVIGAVWAGLRTRIGLWWGRVRNRKTPPPQSADPDGD